MIMVSIDKFFLHIDELITFKNVEGNHSKQLNS